MDGRLSFCHPIKIQFVHCFDVNLLHHQLIESDDYTIWEAEEGRMQNNEIINTFLTLKIAHTSKLSNYL